MLVIIPIVLLTVYLLFGQSYSIQNCCFLCVLRTVIISGKLSLQELKFINIINALGLSNNSFLQHLLVIYKLILNYL